jgi:transcriptional regulator with XRE-family HTH domain
MTPDLGPRIASGSSGRDKCQTSDVGYSVRMHDGPPGDADLGKQIGTVIRTGREETGWSQRELARRLRSSHSAVQRLEAGHSPYVDSRLATAAFRLLGIRSSFDARTLGLAGRREQRDLVHAWCLSCASRRLEAHGWAVRTEVEVGDGRYRGWIDLLAYREVDRCLLCGEINTEIDDVGRIQRTVGWYVREAPIAARRFGWSPRSTTAALLILCSTENDRAVRLNHELLRTSFPGRARDMAQWVIAPGDAPPPDRLAMIDPRSRRAEWLRPTTSDGRRTEAPYRDYRAAAVAIRASSADGR